MTATKTLKLTTRGRYAVMAMVELARRGDDEPVPLVEIAKSGSISLSYLEQLFAGLRRNGLVKSYRGPGGGYVLAKPAVEIRIAEILDSAEDCAPARRSAKGREDDLSSDRTTSALWSQIGEILYVCLRHISLDDVIRERLSNHPMMNKLLETLA